MSRPVLLMCPPDHYDVTYEINPWMRGNLHQASKARATEQWGALHAELAKLAEVKLIAPEPGLPDMVFTANAGLEYRGSVAVSRFHHAERQGEERFFEAWFRAQDFAMLPSPSDLPFEGEGDALFTPDQTRLWAGWGFRTTLESHELLRRSWPVEVESLHLIDPRFYHLDTCFAPLPHGEVLFFPPAFAPESRAAIEAFYRSDRRVAVSEEDALRFCGNVVCVGDTLVLNVISDSLRTELESRGYQVVQVLLDEFLKAGGAAKCLTMHLSR